MDREAMLNAKIGRGEPSTYPEAYKKDDEICKFMDKQLEEIASIVSKVLEAMPEAHGKQFILMLADYVGDMVDDEAALLQRYMVSKGILHLTEGSGYNLISNLCSLLSVAKYKDKYMELYGRIKEVKL